MRVNKRVRALIHVPPRPTSPLLSPGHSCMALQVERGSAPDRATSERCRGLADEAAAHANDEPMPLDEVLAASPRVPLARSREGNVLVRLHGDLAVRARVPVRKRPRAHTSV